jgi:hypothetical protein
MKSAKKYAAKNCSKPFANTAGSALHWLCWLWVEQGYREYSRAAEKTASETFGLSVLEALQGKRPIRTCCAVGHHSPCPNASGGAMIAMLQAAELASDKDGAGAAAKLEAAAVSGDLDQMYRDILNFKRLTVAESGIDAGARRHGV